MTTTITGATGIDNIKAATGAVLQVVQGDFSSTVSTTSTSFQDIPLSISITPSSTSSKILVQVNTYLGVGVGGAYGSQLQLLRDSTAIAIGDADGNKTRAAGVSYSDTHNYQVSQLSVNYLDNPSTTSAITYKVQFRAPWGSSSAALINRSGWNDNVQNNARPTSTIIVQEIAG